MLTSSLNIEKNVINIGTYLCLLNICQKRRVSSPAPVTWKDIINAINLHLATNQTQRKKCNNLQLLLRPAPLRGKVPDRNVPLAWRLVGARDTSTQVSGSVNNRGCSLIQTNALTKLNCKLVIQYLCTALVGLSVCSKNEYTCRPSHHRLQEGRDGVDSKQQLQEIEKGTMRIWKSRSNATTI